MRHPEDKDKKKNDPYYRPEEGDKAPLVKGIYKSSLKNLGTKIRNWESKNLDGRTNGGKTPKIVQIITNVITPQVQLINGIKTFMTGIDIYNQPVYPQYAPGAWNIFAATLDIVGGLSGMGILIDVVTPIAFDLVSTPPQNTIE